MRRALDTVLLMLAALAIWQAMHWAAPFALTSPAGTAARAWQMLSSANFWPHAAQERSSGLAAASGSVVGALERGDRVVELSGRRRGARGVALRGRVARQQLQHLLQLAARAIEVAAQEIVVRLLAQLFGVRRRRRQPQYREPTRPPSQRLPGFATVVPAPAVAPRRRLCLMLTCVVTAT